MSFSYSQPEFNVKVGLPGLSVYVLWGRLSSSYVEEEFMCTLSEILTSVESAVLFRIVLSLSCRHTPGLPLRGTTERFGPCVDCGNWGRGRDIEKTLILSLGKKRSTRRREMVPWFYSSDKENSHVVNVLLTTPSSIFNWRFTGRFKVSVKTLTENPSLNYSFCRLWILKLKGHPILSSITPTGCNDVVRP